MSELTFAVGTFDGPLDLLLKLVNRNKLDIYDIPISLVLSQYLEQIEIMRDNEMEVASEFIIMTSELMLIKSKMLLPKPKSTEEEEDPRAALSRALAEYKRAKENAVGLSARWAEYGARLVKETDEISSDNFLVAPQTLSSLTEAFSHVLLRSRLIDDSKTDIPEANLRRIVASPVSSIPVMATGLLRRLIKRKRCTLDSLFEDCKSKSDIVASFVALLQLVAKSQVIILDNMDGNFTFGINNDAGRKRAQTIAEETV